MNRYAVVAILCAVVDASASASVNYMNPYWTPVSLAPRRYGVFSSPIHFNSLLHQLSNDFSQFSSTTSKHPTTGSTKTRIVDIENGFEVEVELPGVMKKDITVKIEDSGRRLRISGGRNYAIGDDDQRHPSSFDQNFTLDDKVLDTSKIKVSLTNGLLVVKVPKPIDVQEENIRIIPITEPEAVFAKESERTSTESEDEKDTINGEIASKVTPETVRSIPVN